MVALSTAQQAAARSGQTKHLGRGMSSCCLCSLPGSSRCCQLILDLSRLSFGFRLHLSHLRHQATVRTMMQLPCAQLASAKLLHWSSTSHGDAATWGCPAHAVAACCLLVVGLRVPCRVIAMKSTCSTKHPLELKGTRAAANMHQPNCKVTPPHARRSCADPGSQTTHAPHRCQAGKAPMQAAARQAATVPGGACLWRAPSARLPCMQQPGTKPLLAQEVLGSGVHHPHLLVAGLAHLAGRVLGPHHQPSPLLRQLPPALQVPLLGLQLLLGPASGCCSSSTGLVGPPELLLSPLALLALGLDLCGRVPHVRCQLLHSTGQPLVTRRPGYSHDAEQPQSELSKPLLSVGLAGLQAVGRYNGAGGAGQKAAWLRMQQLEGAASLCTR